MHVIGNILYDDDNKCVALYEKHDFINILYLTNRRFDHKHSLPVNSARANGVGIILPGSNPLYSKLAEIIFHPPDVILPEIKDELMHMFDIMESNYDFVEEYVYDMRYEDTFPKTYKGQEYFLCGNSSFDFEHNRIQIGDIWYNVIFPEDLHGKEYPAFSSLFYQRRCIRLMNMRRKSIKSAAS